MNKRRAQLILFCILLACTACGLIQGPTATVTPPPNPIVQVWLTTGNQQHLLARQPDVAISPAAQTDRPHIQIDANQTYQQMEGFGAALTDSSAWLIAHMPDEAQTEGLMQSLFSPIEGIGLSYLRLAIGASDFVTQTHYTYNDLPPRQTDPGLEFFSIDADRAYILPLLRRASAINPQLQVMASPWSAPAWMKTPQTLYGGSLQYAHYAAYADYLIRFIQAYQSEGIPIHALTVQNEPRHTDNRYPTMRMAYPEQARFIRDYLGPALEQAGLHTKILIWDHNWDGTDYALGVLDDAEAKRYVDGVAWHCYAGTPDAQTVVHEAHPGLGVYFTECSGGGWDTDFESVLDWNMRNLFIGSIRHGAKTVLLWNLALDEQHGPHLGGCNDCRGVVTVRRNGTVEYNVEYYLLGHLSKFVAPGAQRIASETHGSPIETVAFRNPDHSLVLVAYNPGLKPSEPFQVEWQGQAFSYTLPRRSVATFVTR